MLIEAIDSDEAREKAEKIGQEIYDDQGTNTSGLTIDEHEAVWVFVGLHKLIECRYMLPLTQNFSGEVPTDESIPLHGTEVTYSRLDIENEDEFKKYINGNSAIIWYQE
ncbi:MAG: hypothetical protein HC914_14880 [Chloroflexaceae bacterium]|nr:hypothetical protein [Chloroflexaceae bacterium]